MPFQIQPKKGFAFSPGKDSTLVREMYKPYMELVPLNMKGGVAAEVRESL